MAAIDASSGQYGFPNGHLGHLTDDQQKALNEFKNLVISENLYNASQHTDALLLRFLRARRFVSKDALQQFKDTEHWRKVNDLDDVYLNIDVEDYDLTRRYYTHWIGRRDKRGLPICLFRIGALDSKAMSAYAKSLPSTPQSKGKDKAPAKLLPLFATFENLASWMSQLCTVLSDRPNPEVPITQCSNIVDISNVGLRQFWNLKAHMQDATVLSTSHYPEMLDRIFIVGAPSFFPTVWSWIKGIFDPITASKIFILSDAQAFSTLSQWIDPENIPRKYGGSLDFDFGDIPSIDPAYADRLTWQIDGLKGMKDAEGELRRWPRGPVKWNVREDGDWDLLAVGSVEGKQRRDVVATLKVDERPEGWADQSPKLVRPQKEASSLVIPHA